MDERRPRGARASPSSWRRPPQASPRTTRGCSRCSRRRWRSCSRPGWSRWCSRPRRSRSGSTCRPRRSSSRTCGSSRASATSCVTPGEYTQLTGRAGRRGIDALGHAVVVYQRQVPFERVAGLAATRTYDLTSSFRPSYNMAVNLVRNYTRGAGAPDAEQLVRAVPGRPRGGRARAAARRGPARRWRATASTWSATGGTSTSTGRCASGRGSSAPATDRGRDRARTDGVRGGASARFARAT